MDKQYVFATHIGIGNRGCEALTKSLCSLLDLPKEQTEIYSEYYEEDTKSDLDYYGKIIRVNQWKELPFLNKLFYKLKAFGMGDSQSVDLMKYDLSRITPDSIVLMTGGDLYCYENSIKLMKYIHQYAVDQQAVTMLIGCSIEKRLLTADVVDDLNNYDVITVRESITLNNLKQKGIEKNVFLIPDSAFVLCPQSEGVIIPANKEIVGINISVYVNNGESRDTLFLKNIEKLIKYILKNTDKNIMLIPHVFWKTQDDRKIMKHVKALFPTDRVWILNSEGLNYCQIRYAISQCRFFMGARTHSVISAYSTCVPTIALGYSVKSAGIARDLGMDDKTVVNCKTIKDEDELLQAYLYLQNNEKRIKDTLKNRIPSYIKEVSILKEILERAYEKY